MELSELARLREIERFLIAIRDLTDKDMTVQRLNVLLEVAIRGPVEQGEIIRVANLKRSATSKNVAAWTTVDAYKNRGLGCIRSDIDQMNMRTRVLSLTSAGSDILKQALKEAGLASATGAPEHRGGTSDRHSDHA